MDDLDYHDELLSDERLKEMLLSSQPISEFAFGNSFSLKKLMNTLRKNVVLMVWVRTSSNQREAARLLGLPEPIFCYQMTKLQIPRAG